MYYLYMKSQMLDGGHEKWLPKAKIVKAIGNFFETQEFKSQSVLHKTNFMESLILAQDERWRRA